MFREKIAQKIFKTSLGLQPQKKDDRDLGFWNIFGADYKPKHTRKVLKPLKVKWQKFNTCGWCSSTGAKEIDERVELDERTMVMFGKEAGYISYDGFSTLRNNEKIMQKKGVAEKGMLNVSGKKWSDYCNPAYLTQAIRDNADKHRSKTYFAINHTFEIYKAIDRGRPVKIGINWRSAFNMGEGFSFPWILNFIKGWLVGGHAMFIYGYNLEYKGQKVFIIRNSFNENWGDNGDCYILEKDMQKQISKYGAFTNEDMDIDIAKWLVSHQGKIVKSKDIASVYLIQGNKKRQYDDEATLVAHGKAISNIVIVDNEYLCKIERGENIDFWSGGNVKQVREMIRQHKNLKELYKNYFNELLYV